MSKKFKLPVKEVVLVGLGLAGGALAVKVMGHGAAQRLPQVRSTSVNLPQVEIQVDGQSYGEFLYARTPKDRGSAWMQYLTASSRGDRAKRVLLEWEGPGRYPLMDVPPDLAVVWVGADNVIQGTSMSPGSNTNLILPSQMVFRAFLVDKEKAPVAGGHVTVLAKQVVNAS